MFLGAAVYDRTDHGLVVRDGTQLGQLRAEHEIDPPPVEADGPTRFGRHLAERGRVDDPPRDRAERV